jgi:hypothetical protein
MHAWSADWEAVGVAMPSVRHVLFGTVALISLLRNGYLDDGKKQVDGIVIRFLISVHDRGNVFFRFLARTDLDEFRHGLTTKDNPLPPAGEVPVDRPEP